MEERRKRKMKQRVNYVCLLIALFAVFALSMTMMSLRGYASASIWTDKSDYTPGETVIIYGSGFISNAPVTITISRPDSTVDTIYASTDGSGAFSCSYQMDGIEGTYTVTATDGTNTAGPITFTDGNTVGSVSVSPGSVTVTQGTTASYTVTVYRKSGSGGGAFDATLSVENPDPGFPSGSTFTPNPVHFGSSDASKTSTLTVPTDTSTSPDTYKFKVKAQDYAHGGTATTDHIYLVVQAACQYKLTMATNFGTTSPSIGDHWYTAGSLVTISATAPAAGSGEQYVWNGWTGSGSGSYTGMDNSHQITFDSHDITETASWTHQYYLTVNSAHDTPGGAGWYASGSTAHATLASGTVSGGAGTQYVFTGWGTDASGTNYAQSNPITMDGPKTATASWKTQYYLTVNNGGHGTASGSGWYDCGDHATFSISPTTVPDGVGVQYVFTGWSGSGSGSWTGPDSPTKTITMDSTPVTETACWKTQYKVSFYQFGLDWSADWHTVLTVGSTNYFWNNLPVNVWVDSGTTFTWESMVSDGMGGRFVKTGESGLTSPITTSGTSTVCYKKQYYLTVNSAHGTTSGSGWYDVGQLATFSITPTTVAGVPGVQYVFTGWTGIGVHSWTGPDSPTHSIWMDSTPVTETACWKTQYYLTVMTFPEGLVPQPTPPSGWYDEGTDVTLTAPKTANSSCAPYIGYTFQWWLIDKWVPRPLPVGSDVNPNPTVVHMDAPIYALAKYYRTYPDPIGDVNFDGVIDLSDIALIAKNYGAVNGDARYIVYYDVNLDGRIDLTDLAAAARHLNL